MPFEGAVAEAYNSLSEEKQQTIQRLILQMADYPTTGITRMKNKPFPYGVLKGKIEIYDNFDDPLPEFKEYM